MPLPSPLPPLCAKPAQRAPLADVLLVVAERGETYEPSDVRWKIANCAGERRRNKMTEANVARPCSSKKKKTQPPLLLLQKPNRPQQRQDSFLLADPLALESERWGDDDDDDEGKNGKTPRM